MKKLLLISVSVGAMVLGACGSGSQEKAKNDSIAQAFADSLAKVRADSIAKVQAKADSIARIEAFKKSATSDLKLFDLYGNVKSVTITSGRQAIHCEAESYDGIVEGSETYRFTNDGKLQFSNNYETLSRNSLNQICSFDGDGMMDEKIAYYSYKYHENGTPSIVTREYSGGTSGHNGYTTYHYDASGKVSQTVYVGDDRSRQNVKITETYVYNEFDSIGNWTSRTVNRQYSYTDVDWPEGRYTKNISQSDSFTDNRIIRYY